MNIYDRTKLTTFKVLVPSKHLSEVSSAGNDEEEARQEFHFQCRNSVPLFRHFCLFQGIKEMYSACNEPNISCIVPVA